MKRLRIVLALLLIVIVGLGAVYVALQRWATRRMTAVLRERVKAVVQNPGNLTVTNAPVKLLGPRRARIPRMEIDGNNLVMPSAIDVKSARVTLCNVEVGGQSPATMRFDDGDFAVTLTDEAVTRYLQRQPDYQVNGVTVETKSLTVHFRDGAVDVEGNAVLPQSTQQRGFTMQGALMPTSDGRGVRCAITRVEVPGRPDINPHLLGDIDQQLPLRTLLPNAAVKRITTLQLGDGTLTLRGTLEEQ